MYGKSPARVLPLLLSLQLTGKNWRASRIFYITAHCKDRTHGLKKSQGFSWEIEPQLQLVLVRISPKLQFCGLFWGSTLGKQV